MPSQVSCATPAWTGVPHATRTVGILTDLNTRSFVVKHGEKIHRHPTTGKPQANSPLDSWHALLLFQYVALPLITSHRPSSSSPPHPTFIFSFTLHPCLISPSTSGESSSCQHASLITAEPSFSALPWEWRSFVKNKKGFVAPKCAQLSWTKAHSYSDNRAALICSFGSWGVFSKNIFTSIRSRIKPVHFRLAYFACSEIFEVWFKTKKSSFE